SCLLPRTRAAVQPAAGGGLGLASSASVLRAHRAVDRGACDSRSTAAHGSAIERAAILTVANEYLAGDAEQIVATIILDHATGIAVDYQKLFVVAHRLCVGVAGDRQQQHRKGAG